MLNNPDWSAFFLWKNGEPVPANLERCPSVMRALRNAPQLVAIATAAAGHSGLLGSLSEGLTAASAFAQAAIGCAQVNTNS